MEKGKLTKGNIIEVTLPNGAVATVKVIEYVEHDTFYDVSCINTQSSFAGHIRIDKIDIDKVIVLSRRAKQCLKHLDT